MSKGAGLTTSINDSHIEGNVIIKDNHVHVYASAEKKYIPLHEFLANSQHLPPALPHYYELHLAERDMRPREDKEDERIPHEVRRHLYLDPKRETERWYNPQPASQRLASISHTPNKAVHVILGEPGGGKTTLLTEWAHDAYRNYQANPSSAPFPIYMRLRELHNYEDKSQSKNETLQHYYQQRKTKFFDLMPFIQGKAKALWFFDGWDELPETSHDQWKDYINDLAGIKILSCRFLRYQKDFRHIGKGNEYLIYGLNAQQQRAYLQKILPQLRNETELHHNADAVWIDELLQQLHSDKHTHLRQLTISPLLLKLIAETNPPNHIVLPNTRTQFYEDAITQMLQREKRLGALGAVKQKSLKLALAGIANSANLDFNFTADKLADGLNNIAENNEEIAHELEINFIKCGILRKLGHNYEFLHATFHEWALAHYLAQKDRGLLCAIQTHWQDEGYDEVISLLWIHQNINDEQREETTYFLMEAGCKPQKNNRKHRRSGLKQSIFFWEQSGKPIPSHIADKIWQKCNVVEELRYALTTTKTSFFNRKLAKDADTFSRWKLASNEYLTKEVMMELSQDTEESIRFILAENPKITIQVMQILMHDPSTDVRRTLAENRSIPPSVMMHLSEDTADEVRRSLARNPKLPLNIIDVLLKDESQNVQRNLASNPSLSHAVMWQLAKDKSPTVTKNLLTNRNIPQTILAYLSDKQLKKLLAKDEKIPQERALELVHYHDDEVRCVLASNPNINGTVMDILAHDPCVKVRAALASNIHLPLNLSLLLLKDGTEDIHINLARNPTISNEIMLELALNSDKVRWFLSHNLSISPNLAWKLAREGGTHDTHFVLSGNPNIPEELMLFLADNASEDIHKRLIANPSISFRVMYKIFQQAETDIRLLLAEHRYFCWEAFLSTPLK